MPLTFGALAIWSAAWLITATFLGLDLGSSRRPGWRCAACCQQTSGVTLAPPRRRPLVHVSHPVGPRKRATSADHNTPPCT